MEPKTQKPQNQKTPSHAFASKTNYALRSTIPATNAANTTTGRNDIPVGGLFIAPAPAEVLAPGDDPVVSGPKPPVLADPGAVVTAATRVGLGGGCISLGTATGVERALHALVLTVPEPTTEPMFATTAELSRTGIETLPSLPMVTVSWLVPTMVGVPLPLIS